jgi:4'-phosphopantetheinyl transferase
VNWEPGPLTPARPESEAHVWRARLDDPRWPETGELPAGDRERAEHFLRRLPARRWAASRWALRFTLAAYLDEEPSSIELDTEANGKPRLRDDNSIRFNLSHSHDLALIGVTRRREIGIDIERKLPDRDFLALARDGLAPEAAELVRRAPVDTRSDVFYAAWARREAVAKCNGDGLGAPPVQSPVVICALDVGPEWAAAVALAGSGPASIRCFDRVP